MGKRQAIGYRLRFDVLKRDGFACRYCGQRPPDVVLHLDHVVPVSRGGTDEMSNLCACCPACNQGKGAEPVATGTLIEEMRRIDREIEEAAGEPEDGAPDECFFDPPVHHVLPVLQTLRSRLGKPYREVDVAEDMARCTHDGVTVGELMREAKACASYHEFATVQHWLVRVARERRGVPAR